MDEPYTLRKNGEIEPLMKKIMQPKLRGYDTNATEAVGVPAYVDEFRQLNFLTHYDHTTAFVSDY